MEIKEKLVALRKEKGLTQLAVAEKLNVSRQAISRWESGIALPSTDNLKSLSALYGVPIDYLLNSDVERERDQVQTDMHCGEQAIPQRKDKRKRVIIGLAILLLVAIVVLAFTKERSKQDSPVRLRRICTWFNPRNSIVSSCSRREYNFKGHCS